MSIFTKRLWRSVRASEGGAKIWFILFRICSQIPWRIARRLGWGKLLSLPTKLFVEPNNTCNFACDHCQVTYSQQPPTHLTLEHIRKILRQVPRLCNIHLQGMGEPMLNVHLIDLMEYCESRGIAPSIISNGSVYTERMASRLLSLSRSTIVFSLDAATPELFERIRVNGKLETVLNNIDRLVRRRGDACWPKIELRTTAMSCNVSELPSIVRLAKRLGVDKLTISFFLTDWGKADMQRNIASRDVSKHPRMKHLLSEVMETAARLDVPVDTEDSLQRFSSINRCPWVWSEPYITVTGDVVPCCRIADSSVVKMGNVYEEDLSRIWNNKAYQHLRRRIANDDIPHFCRRCYGMAPE